jgi:hypothetical protein
MFGSASVAGTECMVPVKMFPDELEPVAAVTYMLPSEPTIYEPPSMSSVSTT